MPWNTQGGGPWGQGGGKGPWGSGPQQGSARLYWETMRSMRQGICDVRRALEWLATRPNIDPDRLGVTGISLGAARAIARKFP